ncbi:C40 family peptidase [uncultured Adlercreutzia sp.]|uniref:C40 family peptidase n=1 Tax=uncultured Adlercreutzia sp. TaxID=875803 RepID=UPI0025F42588|nr:C40 family peptidase [uncultured Adlercreutzia sp.]
MDTLRSHFGQVRAFALACVLAAACAAFAHGEAHASEEPHANPFTQLETFAHEIRAHVADVAEEAAAQQEAEALEGRRQSVVSEALSHLGVPYVYGGTTPSGFDCSGFTRWVFEHALGKQLPRTAAEQAALGEGVSLDELVPGDLLFWGQGSGVYHVGIYAGDGEYVHASTGGGRVMRATFDYFAPTFAKRVIE